MKHIFGDAQINKNGRVKNQCVNVSQERVATIGSCLSDNDATNYKNNLFPGLDDVYILHRAPGFF